MDDMSKLFTLDWSEFGEAEWMAFAGAGEDAFIAYDNDGNCYVRSVTEGFLIVERFDADGENTATFTMATDYTWDTRAGRAPRR